MLTAIVLFGSVVSSPVSSALAVMPVAASPTFSPGVTCDDTVDDDTRLQLAVASSVDGSVICITADIALSNTLILDDTTVTLRGRPIGDDSIVLTVERSFIHLQARATSPGDDTLVIDTLTLRGRGTSPGGGIVSDRYAIYIRNSTLSENNAGLAGGGAIYAINGAVTIDDSTTFTNNTAGSNGGAIYAAYGDVTITGTTAFTDNDAANGYGGAIYAFSGDVTTSGGTFSDNDAFSAGGAIFATAGEVTVDDSTTFTGNTAGSIGGAIYADDTVTTSGGTFTGNTAGNSGGAIYSAAGRVTIDDTASTTAFSNNAATIGSGGAIYADDTVTTSGGTFTNNTAGFGGGAIRADGPISVTNSTFFGNSADRGGAAWSSSAISLRYTTAVDDSTTAGGVFESGGSSILTILGSVIAPDLAGGSACSRSADDSSYNSFVTDSSCGSGDDTVVVTSRAHIGLSGPLVTDDSTGAQVLIPDDTSILINAAPADLVAGVTTDQLQATRGRSPDDSTTVGAVQVLPLVITGQPASTTVAAGATATFTASGIPGVGTTVNYQWQTSVNDGRTWEDRVGATNSTLALPAVTGSQNGLRVRAQLRDLRDDPESTDAAILSVTVPPPTPTPGPTPPGPSSEPPGPPLVVLAVSRDRAAKVAWSPPASSGTKPVLEYEVESFPNSPGCRVTAPETSCTVTGLRNGSGYVFRVRARSAVGWGEWSAFTKMVTPQRVASITIAGTRDRNEPTVIRIRGRSTGLAGERVTPYVRVSGKDQFVPSKIRPTVGNSGDFSWQRRLARGVTIYFRADGVTSNQLTFSAVRRSASG